MPTDPALRPYWHQLSITFADPHEAEHHLLTHLGPALLAAEADGLITAWFYIRKHPWRLRYLPTDTATTDEAHARLHDQARHLQQHGAAHWAETIYEPETHAFGGGEGMQAAHQLFHADSRHILTHLTADNGGRGKRRELSVLLCTALMRAAGLDRYEQGDIWAQLAAHRPRTTTAPPQRWHSLTSAVQRLVTVDTSPGTTLRTESLRFAEDWLAAFEHTGRTLRTFADNGTLIRGLRAVLTHHIIFHWNRLGLPRDTQATLAHAAAEATFADPRDFVPGTPATPIQPKEPS